MQEEFDQLASVSGKKQSFRRRTLMTEFSPPDGASASRLRNPGVLMGEIAPRCHCSGSPQASADSDDWLCYTANGDRQPEPPRHGGDGNLMQPATTVGITRSAFKLLRYAGTVPPEPYLAQVALAAMHNGRSTEETAAHVALALEGKALQVLLDLTSAEQRYYLTLAAALQRRFGQQITTAVMCNWLTHRCRREGETLGAYAADIHFYAQRGYPTFTPDACEELALCAFIQGLTPELLKEHLRITAPKTFNAALEEAERVEPVLTAKCSQRPRVCQVDIGSLPPSPPVILPIENMDEIGRLGHTHGLYLICSLDGNPCQALVDTGATISIVRPGVLPETNSWWPARWARTTCKIRTVTGGQAGMRGKRLLQVKVGGVEVTHEFWLADIQDPCIIAEGLRSMCRGRSCTSAWRLWLSTATRKRV
ncbi:hypothetical protein LDENG_00225350 [Lucifuga dentata]|nr:hypothetical protein LDENG_00225350 [Lucifuga dentata]